MLADVPSRHSFFTSPHKDEMSTFLTSIVEIIEGVFDVMGHHFKFVFLRTNLYTRCHLVSTRNLSKHALYIILVEGEPRIF